MILLHTTQGPQAAERAPQPASGPTSRARPHTACRCCTQAQAGAAPAACAPLLQSVGLDVGRGALQRAQGQGGGTRSGGVVRVDTPRALAPAMPVPAPAAVLGAA